MPATASKTDILNTILDALHAKRAFDPMPGATHPDVAVFHASPPPPGAGPLIRYARPDDKGQLPKQHFHDWQKAFFARALFVYMQSGLYTAWLMQHVAEQQSKPFSEFEWNVLKTHTQTLIDETAKTYGYDKKTHPVRLPEPGLCESKAGDWEWRNTKALAVAQPTLLVGTALFQAAHLTFLRDMMDEAARRDDFSLYELSVLGRALQRLALNFETGRFHLIPVWAAAAHFDRTNGRMDEALKPQDYAQAWKTFYNGGGFVTEVTDTDGATRRVECAYMELAQKVVSHDVCTQTSNTPMAYALYCLGNTAAQRQPDALTHVEEGLRFHSLYHMPQASVPIRTQFDTMSQSIVMRALAHRQQKAAREHAIPA